MILLTQILVTTDFSVAEKDHRHAFVVPGAAARAAHSPSGGLS